jgi:hypothetical protein
VIFLNNKTTKKQRETLASLLGFLFVQIKVAERRMKIARSFNCGMAFQKQTRPGGAKENWMAMDAPFFDRPSGTHSILG